MSRRYLDKFRYFHEIGYHPHQGQTIIHRDKTRHKAISNGRRWGKTLLGGREAEVTAFVKNMLGEPQMGWIIGPNYTDGEKEFRFIYDSLKRLGVDETAIKFVKNVESGNMHITTSWGWDCQVKSAAHPESLVGEGLDWVLLVEAGRLKRTMFTEYVRPALSDKRGWSMMTGVPEIATDISLLYWGYGRGQDVTVRPWASWKMPSWTNDVVFPGGREDDEILEAEDDLTEDEFARQYGGEFVEKHGRVMKEWDDDLHLRDLRFNPDWPLYAAVDYGYTNPFVWLWIQVDPWHNMYVIGEHYIRETDVPEICDRIIKPHPWSQKLVAFYPDPAEPDDTNIISRKLRIPARANTGGELRTRLQMIRQRLKPQNPHLILPPQEQKATITVDRRCTKLAWEMREGYRWPEHKRDQDKNDTEMPLDRDNHGPEALGRFVRGYYEVVDKGESRTRISKAKISRGSKKRRRAA